MHACLCPLISWMQQWLQAKRIAAENNLEFDPTQFNYSSKWLYKFKQAFNINHARFHGEGADAVQESVAICRRQLPALLASVPVDKIYNFDETGEAHAS